MTDMIRTHGVLGLLQTRDGALVRTTDKKLDTLFLEKITAIKNSQSPNTYFKLCSCNSADNGLFSNAQAIANRYNICVMGFRGVINKNAAKQAVAHSDKHPIFHPQTNKFARKISELGNNFIGCMSKIHISAKKINIPEPFPN